MRARSNDSLVVPVPVCFTSQESLGGRARTCIIATLSPSIICVDETMSTLDYAHRAKNIKNKPEVNQKMTKRVLLRECSSTIERLKAELQATREKNGVYLPIEQYQKMEMNLQGQSSQLTELEVRLVACRGWWRVHGRVCCVRASSNTGMRRWRHRRCWRRGRRS